MTKRIGIGLFLLIFALVVVWGVNYAGIFDFGRTKSLNADDSLGSKNIFSDTESNNAATSPNGAVAYKVEIVAENFTVPWSIAFTDSQRMLVSERTGAIKEVVNGVETSSPLITFSTTARGGEIGLMGIAVDPDYASNKFVYACLGYRTADGFADQVVQLRDDGSSLEQVQIILDGIPAGSNHAGCELAFGPDGKLYISTGDATERNIAQDLNSLGGKILRIHSDGSLPSDNPFPNSAVYTYGHRNPQGIDWTSQGLMYEAEHGPSGNDGPGGGDEINLITAGSNYGWPLVSHEKKREGTVAPLITYTPAEAPSSLLVYKGDIFPQFKDTVFVAALRGQGILWLQIDPSDPTKILNSDKLDEINVGRVREIMQGPDGLIYFTSSNTDGRGNVRDGDDKIYRLAPVDM